MKKMIAFFAAIMLAAVTFTGCGNSNANTQETNQSSEKVATEDRKTIEMKQNDYRGGITRMGAIQNSILKVMETMKSNNTIIREDSPNSFWTAEGYQDFVATFLDTTLIADTCWFNEEEGDWETTLQMMCSEKNDFNTPSNEGYALACTVTRLEKDDYLVSNLSTNLTLFINGREKTYNSDKSQCRVLYDCDKDWCKAYLTQTIDEGIPDVTNQMIEYMRIDNDTFAIQTSRERLMVVLKPAEADTDLREREIKEFYYSKLTQEGMRTTFEPYLPLPELDEAMGEVLDDNIRQNEYMESFKGFNEKGDMATRYGQHDSVFFRSPQEITPENYVFEDKSLQQAICYKDGVLVVTTYNKLSGTYERFTYAAKDADSKIADELEKMVAINKLVGIQQLPENDENETSVDKEDTTNTTESVPTNEENTTTDATDVDENSTKNTEEQSFESTEAEQSTEFTETDINAENNPAPFSTENSGQTITN